MPPAPPPLSILLSVSLHANRFNLGGVDFGSLSLLNALIPNKVPKKIVISNFGKNVKLFFVSKKHIMYFNLRI